ncbi:ribbon-helix-helix domain-containing protein [Actinoplanes sp. CA-252034]|uniref:ribbon-helix-helix domain-containing protein n=1 Tax=Actinoplanes sp. CA-252034 TaxID=3239906 RepID=UPI003D988CB6
MWNIEKPHRRAGGDGVNPLAAFYLVAPTINTVIVLVVASLAMSSRLGGSKTAPKSSAVQVRLAAEQRSRLQLLEDHAKGAGLGGYTRSDVIREAVAAYLAPLVAQLRGNDALGRSDVDRLASDDIDAGREFGDAMRIRLDDELVAQLDRVEAYARGLGYRHVTRSSIIRQAVTAYLTGFEKTLSADLPQRPPADSVTDAG